MSLRNSQEATEAGAGGGRGEAVVAVRQAEKIVVKQPKRRARAWPTVTGRGWADSIVYSKWKNLTMHLAQ